MMNSIKIVKPGFHWDHWGALVGFDDDLDKVVEKIFFNKYQK